MSLGLRYYKQRSWQLLALLLIWRASGLCRSCRLLHGQDPAALFIRQTSDELLSRLTFVVFGQCIGLMLFVNAILMTANESALKAIMSPETPQVLTASSSALCIFACLLLKPYSLTSLVQRFLYKSGLTHSGCFPFFHHCLFILSFQP